MDHKTRRIIALIPIICLVYLSGTLILYDLILMPQVNKLTGQVVSSVNVTEALESICDFKLYSGKNLVSYHCITGMFPRDFVLGSYEDYYDKVFSYDPMDTNDPWKSHNPNLPSWVVNDLEWMEADKGYWIFMNNDTQFYLEGFYNMESSQSLIQGWNLIGYPRNYSNQTQSAFNSLDGNYSLVLQYKAENDTWYYNIPGDNSSTLKIIEPDYGYWINLTTDEIWLFP